jgi:hypothetical protein
VAQKGYHYPNYDQDKAPGNQTTAPNQSLQSSRVSYDAIASRRTGSC